MSEQAAADQHHPPAHVAVLQLPHAQSVPRSHFRDADSIWIARQSQNPAWQGPALTPSSAGLATGLLPHPINMFLRKLQSCPSVISQRIPKGSLNFEETSLSDFQHKKKRQPVLLPRKYLPWGPAQEQFANEWRRTSKNSTHWWSSFSMSQQSWFNYSYKILLLPWISSLNAAVLGGLKRCSSSARWLIKVQTTKTWGQFIQ